jgi:hypothetical protein
MSSDLKDCNDGLWSEFRLICWPLIRLRPETSTIARGFIFLHLQAQWCNVTCEDDLLPFVAAEGISLFYRSVRVRFSFSLFRLKMDTVSAVEAFLDF